MSTSTPAEPTPADAPVRRAGRLDPKTLALAALVVVNAALGLSLLGGFTPDNTAEAAAAQVGRPSEYLMIPGRPIGLNQDVVYIVDTTNGLLSAAGYNQTNGVIEFTPALNLNR